MIHPPDDGLDPEAGPDAEPEPGRDAGPDPGRGAGPDPGPDDPATDTDLAADTEVVNGPAQRRLQTAVALTLVAAIVMLGALGGFRFLRSRDRDPVPAHLARLVAVDANGALATMDGRGGSVVSHPAPGVVFRFPVWSPDGTHVAAIGGEGDSVGVYVFPVGSDGADASAAASTFPADDSGVIYRSLSSAPFYLYWSPDSRQLTFLTNEPDGVALRIASASVGAGKPADAAIVRQGAPLYWDWIDPDRLLAHIGGSGPDSFVGEVGLDGVIDDATLIKPDSSVSLGAFRSPAVSTDGRYRAYLEDGGDAGQRIVVEPRDRSDRHTVAVSGPTAMTFDPTGAALAYVGPDSSATGPAELPIGPLRLLDAASGTSRTLLDAKVVAFFWAPDGKTIATLGVAGVPGGTQAAGPRGGNGGLATLTGFAPLAGAARLPEPAPMGMAHGRAIDAFAATDAAAGAPVHLSFVDVATAAVRATRDVRVSDTFVNQILLYFDQYALSHRFWSADSAALALPLVGADGTDQLTVIPADGSEPHPIPDRVIGFWSP